MNLFLNESVRGEMKGLSALAEMQARYAAGSIGHGDLSGGCLR